MYLGHKFDLLGSGWVSNKYSDEAIGVGDYRYTPDLALLHIDKEGKWLSQVVQPNHLPVSQQIWQLTFPKYTPIDWQKDYKSGYRWSAKKWYKDQKIAPLPGVDIKVPWELARFQHLPQMAVFAQLTPEKKNSLITEFRDQVLDFIATNPPQMGVNWTCTMDVGIRAANILIAYDLFCQLDTENFLDKDFTQIFANSIYLHGKHIVSNLEWFPELTTNHYLSNIAGLLFIASYLDSNTEIDTWLAFGIQELITEVKKQFYADGTNFEASTCYHRLSGELVVYTTALILGLPAHKLAALTQYNPESWHYHPILKSYSEQEYRIENGKCILPPWFISRLLKIGHFTADLTKPTGEVPQMGDNDSGRFLQFSRAGVFLTHQEALDKYRNLKGYEQMYSSDELFWDENSLDHRTFLSALAGLFDEPAFFPAAELYPLEKSIITSLAKRTKLPVIREEKALISPTPITENYLSYPSRSSRFPANILSDIPLNKNLRTTLYPDAGIYMIQSDRLHLTISAGSNGQNGWGGHAHNDKLSFELNIDGIDLVVDPGTYLYTPFPDQRNAFRSVRAHATLSIEEEQNQWLPGQRGLFMLKQETACQLISVGKDYWGFSLRYRNIHHVRFFYITEAGLELRDFCNIASLFDEQPEFPFYSNGYGKLTTAKFVSS